jgi:hypothetical protein
MTVTKNQARTCNPTTQAAGAGGSSGQGQPGLHTKTLSPTHPLLEKMIVYKFLELKHIYCRHI